MKPTDFSKHLSNFILNYLVTQRGASRNTILTYKYTFLLLLRFFEETKQIKNENLTLAKLTKEAILEFLNWLQKERGCAAISRNNRLAAIHSFFRYLQGECVENIYECQRIMGIRLKKSEPSHRSYLSIEGIKLLLQQPDATTKHGRRDLVLLSLMYASGARVQEVIDMTPSAIHMTKPYVISITGKGRKTRTVPLQGEVISRIGSYLQENGLNEDGRNKHPLFQNCQGNKLTRAGVNYIVKKYTRKAQCKDRLLIPEKISCHSLRHTMAMHWLEAEVNLIYIRDALGHSSVKTTEIYARANSKKRREALEKAYSNLELDQPPMWRGDENLFCWLNKL